MNAEAIRDKVAIVGMGCCKFGENWDKAPEDMIVEAAFEAYADAGIESPQQQIEAVFCGSVYPSKGTAEVADALKLFGRPVSMVQNYCATGTDAFRFGVFAIACGMYDTVLVVGFDKPKDRGVSGPSVQTTGVRGLPMTPAGWFSLCAAQLLRDLRRRPRGPRQDRGEEPPQRHAGAEVDAEERDHGRGRAQGADDLVAVRALRLLRAVRRRRRRRSSRARELAKSFRDDYVLVKGVAIAPRRQPAERPELRLPALEADGVRGAAGVRAGGHHQPAQADPLAQVHDCFTLTELLDLRGPRLLREGLRQGAHRQRHLRARRRAAGQHRRRPQDLRPPDRRHRRAHALRELQAAPGQGRASARSRTPTVALSHNIGGAPQACGISILGRE